jgi:hypothetical protein
MEQYPAVAFLVRHGNILAVIAGLAPVILVAAGIALGGWHWSWGLAGIGAGVALGFGVRVFAELVRIIVDMLLPQ